MDQTEKDLQEFTARILGEDAMGYLTRTYREHILKFGKNPNYGDCGRALLEKFEESMVAQQRFVSVNGSDAGFGALCFKAAHLRPVGSGWFVRWRNL